MRSPFPGVDPYLEHPGLWPDVHNSLIAEIRRFLAPRLRPKYFVGIEERTYLLDADAIVLVGRPDVAVRAARDTRGSSNAEPRPSSATASAGSVTVELPMPDRLRETYLEVRSVDDGEVVTVVELLSPSNKADGEGRSIYERKRRVVLGSLTHLVEVDLLRGGRPMPARGPASTAAYRILISREEARPQASLMPFSLRDPIPRFPLPLRPGEVEPELDLGSLLADLYEQAGYDLIIDYRQDPVPALGDDDRTWADSLLRATGTR
jgi:hypothetical protein